MILPGDQRGKESELPGFLQGTTWVEFRGSAAVDPWFELSCPLELLNFEEWMARRRELELQRTKR